MCMHIMTFIVTPNEIIAVVKACVLYGSNGTETTSYAQYPLRNLTAESLCEATYN